MKNMKDMKDVEYQIKQLEQRVYVLERNNADIKHKKRCDCQNRQKSKARLIKSINDFMSYLEEN